MWDVWNRNAQIFSVASFPYPAPEWCDSVGEPGDGHYESASTEGSRRQVSGRDRSNSCGSETLSKQSREMRRIAPPVAGLEELIAEARAEGIDFLDDLIVDWESGKYRFDGPHEGLFGMYAGDELVAIGALSLDPFVGRSDTGRLRRIFVRKAWRRQGIGEAVVRGLLAEARKGFCVVRLRAETPHAAGIYERLGFVAIADENASHERSLLSID